MSKLKPHKQIEIQPLIVAEDRTPYGLRTYISLFSSAGIGCYGFKEESFYCIATVELLEKRLKIQSYNQKCVYNAKKMVINIHANTGIRLHLVFTLATTLWQVKVRHTQQIIKFSVFEK